MAACLVAILNLFKSKDILKYFIKEYEHQN